MCVRTAQENKTIKRQLWPRISSKFTWSSRMIAESSLCTFLQTCGGSLRGAKKGCSEVMRLITCVTPLRTISFKLCHTMTPERCAARECGPLTRAANYRLLRGLGAQRHCMLSFLIKNINACRRKKKKEDQLQRGRTDNSPVPQ